MPTPLSHFAVGYAIGAWTQPVPPTTRVCVAAAACAALPDIDILWSQQLPDSSLFAHRAITHSVAFAVVAALLVSATLFRGRQKRGGVTLGLALLSHSCLDALSTYSLGIAFLAPFSMQRFRFPWTPLGRPGGTIPGQLIEEALVVFVPAVLLAWLAFRVRRASVAPPR